MKEKTDSKSRRARSSSASPRTVAGAGLPPAVGAEIERKAGMSCVKRLPSYLQLLRVLQAEGQEHVSGTVLATVHNLNPSSCEKTWPSPASPAPRASASG